MGKEKLPLGQVQLMQGQITLRRCLYLIDYIENLGRI